MKKNFWTGLIISIFLFGFTGVSVALTLSDVGAIDQLIASTSLANSGETTETNWVNSVLNGNYTMTFKDENGDPGWQWEKIENTLSVFAYDLGNETPAYYLIKTGKIPNVAFDTFLFSNMESLTWAVINLESLGLTGKDITNIGKISHIDGFDNHAPVPEPASLLLLGSGLIGLASLRKRNKKA